MQILGSLRTVCGAGVLLGVYVDFLTLVERGDIIDIDDFRLSFNFFQEHSLMVSFNGVVGCVYVVLKV